MLYFQNSRIIAINKKVTFVRDRSYDNKTQKRKGISRAIDLGYD